MNRKKHTQAQIIDKHTIAGKNYSKEQISHICTDFVN
jgi:hypothetical protein